MSKIKNSIKKFIRSLLRPTFVSLATYIIEPGTSIEYDPLSNRQGQYSAYIDLSDMVNLHALNISIFIRPGPTQKEFLYISTSVSNPSEPLFNVDIPPCYGFRIKYTLGTGKELKIATLVWEI